ncbi:MAG: arylesterase [Rhodospirillales bacterium]|nr:MAG: arylesterase [Rhodospirillales bacterium]
MPSRLRAAVTGILVAAVLAMLALTIALPAGATGPDPTIRILALGDSLTAGFGLPQEDAFPAQLERALRRTGHDVAVIDAGVSGDTTAGGLARLEWALGSVEDGDPDAAIVALGANDGLRGFEPEETFANLDAILSELAQRDIKVLLAGMLAPPNLGRAYGAEFEAVYRRLAERHDVVLYPFLLDGVAARPELNQADGIHPNADGVAVMVERILPSVEALLARAGGTASADQARGAR